MKISKRNFKEKLRRGLGSAIIMLENSTDISKYEDIVLWACLNYTGYDWQSEGSHGNYLYQAISHFKDNDKFINAIINKFSAKMKDSSLSDQLADLLVKFAEDRNQAAREKLYTVYNELFDFVAKRKIGKPLYCHQRDHLEWLCNRLLFLDGFKAFKRIINDLSIFYKTYPNKKDPFDFDWFYIKAKDIIGKKRTENYLIKNGIKYKERNYKIQDVKIDIPTLETVVSESKKPWNEARKFVMRFARNATQPELEKLWNEILKETNLDTKSNMLWAFRTTPFCGQIETLIEYSKSAHTALQSAAFEVLMKIKDEKAYNYAIELLKENRHIEEALVILSKNYKDTDDELIIKFIKNLKIDDKSDWHTAFSCITDLLEENKKSPKELLTYIYNNTLCSFCRYSVVLAMDKRKMITDEFLQELIYDSNSDIRDFAYRKIKQRQRKPVEYKGDL